MTKTILSVLFTVTILLSAAFAASSGMVEPAHALKSKGTMSPNSFGTQTANKVCGDKLCGAENRLAQTEKTETAMKQKSTMGSKAEKPATMKESKAMDSAKMHNWTVVTKTMKSIQDPGVGHESHQLAVILPPSDKPYTGMITYAASEPVQLVALHGPLAEGEDSGQPIWTPDGKTKFALTFVDTQQASGTWNFAGNALAVHTKNKEPFTVSYTVVAGQ